MIIERVLLENQIFIMKALRGMLCGTNAHEVDAFLSEIDAKVAQSEKFLADTAVWESLWGDMKWR